MQSHKNNYKLKDENAVLELAVISVIGNREEQQDSAGYQLKKNEGVVVVCDGMGGHEGGQIAGMLAAEALLSAYSEEYPIEDPHTWLVDMAIDIDKRIADGHRRSGERIVHSERLALHGGRQKVYGPGDSLSVAQSFPRHTAVLQKRSRQC